MYMCTLKHEQPKGHLGMVDIWMGDVSLTLTPHILFVSQSLESHCFTGQVCDGSLRCVGVLWSALVYTHTV